MFWFVVRSTTAFLLFSKIRSTFILFCSWIGSWFFFLFFSRIRINFIFLFWFVVSTIVFLFWFDINSTIPQWSVVSTIIVQLSVVSTIALFYVFRQISTVKFFTTKRTLNFFIYTILTSAFLIRMKIINH